MTIKAMLWAMDEAPVDSPTQFAVLVVLADKAMDGRHAWPSLETIGRRTRMSPRSAQRAILELEASGAISRCSNPAHAIRWAETPAGRRPTLWSLNTHFTRDDRPDDPITSCDMYESGQNDGSGVTTEPGGATTSAGRGDTSGRRVPDNTKHLETNKYQIEFEDHFWKLYPRKLSKAKSRTLFFAARRRGVELDTIMNGLAAYVEETKGREQKFIKHPTTWLGGECWDDEYEATGPKAELEAAIRDEDTNTIERLTGLRYRIPNQGDGEDFPAYGRRKDADKRAWLVENRDKFYANLRT